MPPTPEMIDRAARLLSEVRVESFNVTPTTIQPFEGPATLQWRVQRPPNSTGLAITLNGTRVPDQGTRSVQPLATTTYVLAASMFTVRRQLGSVTVQVNEGACITGAIPEADVRQGVVDAVDRFLDQAEGKVRARAPTVVEVESTGIVARVRLEVNVPNFFDPDLNVDLTIGLRAEGGRGIASYRHFRAEVDWPWWVGVITLGVTELVEGVVNSLVEGALKRVLLEEVQRLVDQQLQQLPRTFRLWRLGTAPNEVRFTVCPQS